jgi:hypothetical protein
MLLTQPLCRSPNLGTGGKADKDSVGGHVLRYGSGHQVRGTVSELQVNGKIRVHIKCCLLCLA